jgi:hypothetical protein
MKAKLAHVVFAKPLSDFKMAVRFDDGAKGVVDLRADIFERGDGEMILPLRDPAFFKRGFVDQFGAIAWPNGYDICPAALHREISGGAAAV